MAGFEFAYDLSGQNTEIVKEYVIANTVVLSAGEMVNLETGELTTAVTADTALVGVVVAAVDNTSDGESAQVTMNPNAVYRVTDANVRVAGATLDIDTGGLGVTGTSNADLIVIEDSAADEPTLVTFNATHYLKR